MKVNLNMEETREEREDPSTRSLLRRFERGKEADLTFRKEMEGWEYRY
jgi:hypothetical protein|nr:MAG TPA: hypothetical protein [Caudoviricetes sp.]